MKSDLTYKEFVNKYCIYCEESCCGKPSSLSDICDECLYDNLEHSIT